MTTNILKGFCVEPEVESFINDLEAHQLNPINYYPIITQFYSVKKLEQLTDNIIKSNEKLSQSNNMISIVLLIFTAVLIFIGLIPVIRSFIK